MAIVPRDGYASVKLPLPPSAVPPPLPAAHVGPADVVAVEVSAEDETAGRSLPLLAIVASCSAALGLIVGLLIAGALVTTSPEEERLADELRQERYAHAKLKERVADLDAERAARAEQAEAAKAKAAASRGIDISAADLVFALNLGPEPKFSSVDPEGGHSNYATPGQRIVLCMNGMQESWTTLFGAHLVYDFESGWDAGEFADFREYAQRYVAAVHPATGRETERLDLMFAAVRAGLDSQVHDYNDGWRLRVGSSDGLLFVILERPEP